MARKIQGGSLKPVKVITSADLKKNGGRYVLPSKTAIPVAGFSSTARGVKGGKAIVVYLVTQAEINAGDFDVGKGSSDVIISVDDVPGGRGNVSGKQAVAVYVTNGWSPAPTPPAVGGPYFMNDYFVDDYWPKTEFYWPGQV